MLQDAGFWAVAGAMAAGTVALILAGAASGRHRSGAADGSEDLAIYRAQLREVERDLARGTVDAAQAAALRDEIARRLLAADRRARAGTPARPARGSLALPALALALAAAGALALYHRLGAPGYADAPLGLRLAEADARIADRPGQEEAVAALGPSLQPEVDPAYLALMNRLRAAVDPASSTDTTGLALLARNELALADFAAARAAQQRLIAVKGDAATADDHAYLAEILVAEAGGYVSPEAGAEIEAALRLDPRNGLAGYLAGWIEMQGGRYDLAFATWRPVVESAPADAPWLPSLREEIAWAAQRAGIRYAPPAAADGAGPDAGDLAAVAAMTPGERQEMIEGMVEQLSARLHAEGGSAEDWARLIRALGVLGRGDAARAARDEARGLFAGQDAELAVIDAAAAELAP